MLIRTFYHTTGIVITGDRTRLNFEIPADLFVIQLQLYFIIIKLRVRKGLEHQIFLPLTDPKNAIDIAALGAECDLYPAVGCRLRRCHIIFCRITIKRPFTENRAHFIHIFLITEKTIKFHDFLYLSFTDSFYTTVFGMASQNPAPAPYRSIRISCCMIKGQPLSCPFQRRYFFLWGIAKNI